MFDSVVELMITIARCPLATSQQRYEARGYALELGGARAYLRCVF